MGYQQLVRRGGSAILRSDASFVAYRPLHFHISSPIPARLNIVRAGSYPAPAIAIRRSGEAREGRRYSTIPGYINYYIIY